MFSDTIKTSLEHEVVGQPAAIHDVVRGMTRLLSGLTPRERSWWAALLVGPPGTGRAHLVRTVARLLYGDEQAVLTVSCNTGCQADPWLPFVHQLAPLFERPGRRAPSGVGALGAGPPGVAATSADPSGTGALGAESHAAGSPPRLVLVQDLECARKELSPLLARMLETGQVALPDGRRGRIDHCMVFLTSGICSREILDETSRIGFAGAASDESDDPRDAIVALCREEAEKRFGIDFLAQLDGFTVFRGLGQEHMAAVLERHFERMSRWMERQGFRCELRPAARDFLLERGMRQTLMGARNLILAHRKEVEFPIADLLLSHGIPPGGRVVVDRKPGDEHLHFTVTACGEERLAAPWTGPRRVPVGA